MMICYNCAVRIASYDKESLASGFCSDCREKGRDWSWRAISAEQRVRELEGAIEHHRAEVENLNDSRLSTESYLAGLYEADEELWAALEGGECGKEEA